MAEKSRVVLYEELRKKISNIDDYSFSQSQNTQEKSKVHQQESVLTDISSTNSEKGIKRNTLTLSIEELLDTNRKYDSLAQEKQMKKRYHFIRREEKKHRLSVSKILVWSMIALVIVAFLIFLILVLLEVL